MPFTLRQFEQEDNFCQQVSLDAFERVIPSTQVKAVLAAYGPTGTRARRLTPQAIVWLVIALHLFSRSSLAMCFNIWSEVYAFFGPIRSISCLGMRPCPLGALS